MTKQLEKDFEEAVLDAHEWKMKCRAAQASNQRLRKVLQEYANGTVKYVTFERGVREKQLNELRSSQNWDEFGEDSRGHEIFVINENLAEEALAQPDDTTALREFGMRVAREIYEADIDTDLQLESIVNEVIGKP